jgi:hypothetical protein
MMNEALVAGYACYTTADEFGLAFAPTGASSAYPATAPSRFACGNEAGTLPVSVVG